MQRGEQEIFKSERQKKRERERGRQLATVGGKRGVRARE